MKTTTIQISNEMKEKIRDFGSEKETDDQIIRKIYELAVKTHLRKFLMSSEGYISIKEARKKLNKNVLKYVGKDQFK